MTTANMRAIAALLDQLDRYDVPRHPDVEKAITAHATLQAAMTTEREFRGRLLDLEPEVLLDRFTEAVTRHNTQATGAAGHRMQSRLEVEASAVMADHVPTILAKLRPTFDRAAKGVNAAAKAGIRPGMTADHVLDLNDQAAVTAWRALPEHAGTLQRIAAIRIELSELFGVAPQITSGARASGGRVDYTACFTRPDTGTVSGYGHERDSTGRWLRLSLTTGGRLRLNDPAETQAMLDGEGESAGWTVDTHSCVVKDGDGRDLILYRGEWLPSWVGEEQIARLVSSGIVSPAQPGTPAPADKHPLGVVTAKASA